MPRESKVPQTQEELSHEWRVALRLLEKRCVEFDRGDRDEYRSIATQIRVMFHKSKSSVPLVQSVQLAHRRMLNTSAPLDPDNLLSHSGIICLHVDAKQRATWKANLDRFEADFVEMESWWNQGIILDHQTKEFSRKDIVTYIADQAGGAHVDVAIGESFHRLRRDGLSFVAGIENARNPEMHALRQIAHEVLKSFKPAYFIQSKAEVGLLIRMPTFRRNGPPPRPEARHYANVDPDELCPCSSGQRFGDCHKIGAQNPIEVHNTGGEFIAPEDAAYAFMRIESR